ncbi:hypothetical protein M0638_02825 [Roseomonas sp. NAR14]|uniref:Uncharacterized protein n=1 Tax=Roseomonas acroporae TaxID=2937791 RepID=A0A9X2BW05_9PROT|nr:hypothetical protein [Roseomonas acroporae]MCK8783315.1 hypothetical protein [Roseomonas acroporae]
MDVPLGAVHYVYLCGVAAIIASMVLRANVVVPAIVATFAVAATFSGSLVTAVTAVFNGSLVAAKELFNIFLVIALMTSLLHALRALGADQMMVRPFRRVMTNGHVAFLVLAACTYLISLFFWPTPAVPLVAATLLPAAIAAGLPAMGAAIAIAVAGQGMALSSDYVIRVAPAISARAAGIADQAGVIADKALLLSLVTGAVALGLGYLRIRASIAAPSPRHLARWQAGATLAESLAEQREEVAPNIGSFDKSVLALQAAEGVEEAALSADTLPGKAALAGGGTLAIASAPTQSLRWGAILAVVTPIAFLLVIAFMLAPKVIPGLPELKGGDAAAMVGGTAALMMLIATFAADGAKAMHTAADHIVEGFVFSFRAMGTVLPIAGFFFLGSGEFSRAILGLPAAAAAPDLLFETIRAAQHLIPQSEAAVAFAVLLVGMITGIDGSGFAGLPLTGALSGALAPVSGAQASTLAAVGQMGAVWTGGGTLIAWSSLIAVAGFARVPVLDVVRMLFPPVVAGLVLSTAIAVVLW